LTRVPSPVNNIAVMSLQRGSRQPHTGLHHLLHRNARPPRGKTSKLAPQARNEFRPALLMMHAEHALAPRARAVRGGAGPQPAAFEDDEQPGGAAGAATVLTLLAGGPGPADPEQGASAPAGVLELPVDLAGADAPPCAPALLLGAPAPLPPLSLVLSCALPPAASKGCAPDFLSSVACMANRRDWRAPGCGTASESYLPCLPSSTIKSNSRQNPVETCLLHRPRRIEASH